MENVQLEVTSTKLGGDSTPCGGFGTLVALGVSRLAWSSSSAALSMAALVVSGCLLPWLVYPQLATALHTHGVARARARKVPSE